MKSLDDLLPKTAVDASLPIPEFVHVSEIDLKKHFGLRSLKTSFKTDHMTTQQRNEISDLFRALREWRERLHTVPVSSFVLVGDPGLGKTHIAECVYDSMCTYAYGDEMIDLNDPEALRLVRHARFYTASELMREMEADTFSISKQTKLIVVDEIGREGTLKWEKRDFENQNAARLHYYFQFIDTCIKQQCALFITSNVTSEQFKAFFDKATLSRLFGMIAPGHMYEMVHCSDYRLIQSGRVNEV